ncbi:unnamed protein product [Caenorhabditis bovis]|uniref:Uncharacterized protein n=1 Tax=Caenorhabditis bovis TaxID=2654633 RepID=A0A8S1E919_9PELO|nr:unnamed protein product [Caenorhabditis bovis]
MTCCSRLLTISTVIVGTSAAAALIYYYLQSQKNEKKSERRDAAGADAISRRETDEHVESDEDDALSQMFQIEDENVRKVVEKIFVREINLGEELIANAETAETGAIHLSNAIALSGESDELLAVLQKSMSNAKYSLIMKYMPTADFRIYHLMQDELEEEVIHAAFA